MLLPKCNTDGSGAPGSPGGAKRKSKKPVFRPDMLANPEFAEAVGDMQPGSLVVVAARMADFRHFLTCQTIMLEVHGLSVYRTATRPMDFSDMLVELMWLVEAKETPDIILVENLAELQKSAKNEEFRTNSRKFLHAVLSHMKTVAAGLGAIVLVGLPIDQYSAELLGPLLPESVRHLSESPFLGDMDALVLLARRRDGVIAVPLKNYTAKAA